MKHILILLTLIGTVSCGQYVAYDGEPTPPPKTATLEDFPDAKTLNHVILSGLMAQYTTTSEDGGYVYFDYRGLSQDEESVFLLDYYLASLASIDPNDLETEADRQVYWYNGYNAAVIKGVVREFNQSVAFKVIDNGSFFNDPFYNFGGTVISLNQLEQGVLRGDFEHENVKAADAATQAQIKTWFGKVWKDGKFDARFHAALNCGALGCPNLIDKAPYVWKVDTLEEDLTAMTRAWLDNPEKGAGPNGISNLFEWYKPDFVASEGSVEAFIAKYRTDGANNVDLNTIINYDWTLNAPENAE